MRTSRRRRSRRPARTPCAAARRRRLGEHRFAAEHRGGRQHAGFAGLDAVERHLPTAVGGQTHLDPAAFEDDPSARRIAWAVDHVAGGEADGKGAGAPGGRCGVFGSFGCRQAGFLPVNHGARPDGEGQADIRRLAARIQAAPEDLAIAREVGLTTRSHFEKDVRRCCRDEAAEAKCPVGNPRSVRNAAFGTMARTVPLDALNVASRDTLR